MAHVDDLAVEILGLIFTALNQINPNSSLALSLVCRHFRTVVFTTPRAWTNVLLDLDRYKPGWLTRTVLIRSKSCLIDIQIAGQCHSTIVQVNVAQELNAHLFRTRKLLIEPKMDIMLVNIVAHLSGSAPFLEEIKATGHFWRAFQAFSQLHSCKSLRSIEFEGCLMPFPLSSPALTTALTTLRITSPTPPTSVHLIAKALQSCCNTIESFSFTGVSHWDAEPALPSTLILPHLHTLSLTLDDATSLLVYLKAPALRSLSLQRKISTRNNQPEMAVSDFLVRSAHPPVTRLVVDNVGMGPEAWVRCLRALPRLESLTSRDPGFSDAVLDALRVKHHIAEEVICPKLTSWTTRLNFSTTRVLLDFLNSRNPPRTRRNRSTPHARETLSVEGETHHGVSCIKHLELHGSRPNDAAIRTIQFIMIASDPMREGTFEHTFVAPRY